MKSGSGHCLCKAVQYAFDAPPNWQAHCHCESCRRNCAAPFTSYFGVSHGQWRWTGAQPATFSSTPGVSRHFCAACGTPMAYESSRWPHEIHFYAATLADPASYEPTLHVNWGERVPWLHLSDDLPKRSEPRRLRPEDDAGPVLALVREAFTYMDGVIDPPSSMHRLTEAAVSQQAETGEVWIIDDLRAPIACIFLTLKPGRLYIGKLSVRADQRGRGLARQLVELAEKRAEKLGLPLLELESRVELVDNHRTFLAMGFEKTGESAHEGYDRPTSFTFAKNVAPAR
ncbi:MAG: GNAT family N-acetyltransferase [Rhodobacteraceae bacterium]|nr:GNAT family N-acetyltransferase [Paracoccaceae bacterium]